MAPGDCCIPPPPADYEGKGTEETWDGLSVYRVGSPRSSSAVLFICDIYGWRIPQTRYLADKIAAHGHYVLLPDFFHGDFFSSSDPDNPYAGLRNYLARHPTGVVVDAAAYFVERLRSNGAKKVGVVGNCWGAKITVGLLRGNRGVDAAVINHPSLLTKEDIAAVRVPLALLAASIDIITPPAMALEFGQILAASPEESLRIRIKIGDKSFVKIYQGADHGWTTRYDLEDETALQRAEEAHDEILAWFARFLVDYTT